MISLMALLQLTLNFSWGLAGFVYTVPPNHDIAWQTISWNDLGLGAHHNQKSKRMLAQAGDQ
jgi:hypothetical protein